MKGGKSPLGYTIVEVMIVLAVSGIMFVVAANFINGKQQKTTFTNGVNEMASRIQDIIEQVSDGQYSDIPFSCKGAAAGALTISSTISDKTQGTNKDCVFIGKFLHFSVDGNRSAYEVFSLAAARASTSLGPDVTPVLGDDIDLTDQQIVPQSLEITKPGDPRPGVKVTGAPGTYYGFGFAQSQGSEGDALDTYASGAQMVNLIYGPALQSSTAKEGDAASAITGHVAIAQSISFELTDGNQCAQISIGAGNGSQLDVNVTIEVPRSCLND
jgi:prepilin-type N-terminal cleavage/methylation domain-containing protein